MLMCLFSRFAVYMNEHFVTGYQYSYGRRSDRADIWAEVSLCSVSNNNWSTVHGIYAIIVK